MNRFKIRHENISGEVIDNELIIINLAAGTYFNSTGAGPLLWRAMKQGADMQQAISFLATKSREPTVFAALAQNWVDTLVCEGILMADDAGEGIEEYITDQSDISSVEPPGVRRS